MAQTFDSTTHNSIDIVIGPWEDEQAGVTGAAPSDLDIDIYLLNDNGEVIEPLMDRIVGRFLY